MSTLSYDQLIQDLIEAKKQRDGSTWHEAAICYVLREQLQVAPSTIAGDVGYSGRHVSQLCKTFAAFPTEDTRALDLTYSHHQVAATSSEPSYWIEQALINGWSVREMQAAMKGEAVRDPLEDAQKLWDRVLKFIAQPGPGSAYLEEQIRDYI